MPATCYAQAAETAAEVKNLFLHSERFKCKKLSEVSSDDRSMGLKKTAIGKKDTPS
jgi:hypothetical protein